MTMTVTELVQRAWAVGSAAPLEGIRRHTKLPRAPDYYHFLYGLCRVVEARTVLEIGTDFGGSILAMREAVQSQEHTLVTVDITELSDEQLAGAPDVVKVKGDASTYAAITEVVAHLSPPIDLLYIDTKHDFPSTMSVYGVYTMLLAPRVIVCDDITLRDDMRWFWTLMRGRYGERAVNAVEIIPEIRRHPLNPGFGVILTEAEV